jgi:ATP-dependent DNA helicase RecG
MHRMLMGDVGSGKTVVALFAMLLAMENDYQAALMAPTELLAEQHAANVATLLASLGIEPTLLVGRLGAAEKRAVHERIASGDAALVIGTHALIQEAVSFHRLGLVVIDEQHRFGVEQRARLIEKGDAPDVLLLSATPIPRSLALARYGDLDLTLLRERPAGRQPIKTSVKTERGRQRVYAFLRQECAAGRQAYVVYPVIEESERADLRAAATMAEDLAVQFPELVVGLVHGRLPAEEREATMRRFRDGQVDLLVATTVIEVGIDVANATVMIVEHAERFGLAQLHQLRGRVGRGSDASYCVLFSPAGGRDRLRAFSETDDGFRIAELDLAERGHGELAGTRQSGVPELRFVRFPDDMDLLERARDVARQVLAGDANLEQPEHRLLRERLLRRHGRAVELFRVG